MKKIIIMLAISIFSFSPAKGETSLPTAIQRSGENPVILADYLKIKNALVADDFEQAQKAAIEMTANYEDYIKDLKEPAQFIMNLNKFVHADDLQAQRMIFKEISKGIYESIRKKELDEFIYWQSCPMALDGQGAKWISLDQKVRNPYMGQKMVACGETIEKLVQ